MDEQVRQIVRDAVEAMIKDVASEQNLAQAKNIHEAKIHFVPKEYRILGGRLQSLNIKYGNFIEKLIAVIVERDTQVESLPDSGHKLKLPISPEVDGLIDQYITSRTLPDSSLLPDEEFQQLLNEIIRIESSHDEVYPAKKNDVDALFKSADGTIVYLEIKYNDDHDTGKFLNINRKFIKTFAGLVKRLDIQDISQIKPILYYFNASERWKPIYVPTSNIYRGSQLFTDTTD